MGMPVVDGTPLVRLSASVQDKLPNLLAPLVYYVIRDLTTAKDSVVIAATTALQKTIHCQNVPMIKMPAATYNLSANGWGELGWTNSKNVRG